VEVAVGTAEAGAAGSVVVSEDVSLPQAAAEKAAVVMAAKAAAFAANRRRGWVMVFMMCSFSGVVLEWGGVAAAAAT
jgi:hypothetical protein